MPDLVGRTRALGQRNERSAAFGQPLPSLPPLDVLATGRESGGKPLWKVPILLIIRPAVSNDAQTLTKLMHASAAYKGAYASILDGYAVTPAQIEKDIVYIAAQDDSIAGFYSLTLDGEPELDLMFVADGTQGTGLGALLFQHMRVEARRRGISAIKIISHPPSVGFYQKMGARIIGRKEPTGRAMWKRPILTLPV